MARAFPHWVIRKVTPALAASGGHGQAFAYTDISVGDWSVWELRSEVEVALHERQPTHAAALAYVLARSEAADSWAAFPNSTRYWSPREPSIVYRNGAGPHGRQRWRTLREWIDAGIDDRWDLSINTDTAMASLAPFEVYRPSAAGLVV
jgi:hypothetical protein